MTSRRVRWLCVVVAPATRDSFDPSSGSRALIVRKLIGPVLGRIDDKSSEKVYEFQHFSGSTNSSWVSGLLQISPALGIVSRNANDR